MAGNIGKRMNQKCEMCGDQVHLNSFGNLQITVYDDFTIYNCCHSTTFSAIAMTTL